MRIFSLPFYASAFATLAFVSASASVVGTNPPSQPLTEQRIDALPRAQQAAWKQYLEKSQHQMQVDKNVLQAELKKAGTAVPPAAAHGGNARSTPAGRDLVASPGAPLIWARYYQIGTDRPLFGDRDKSIHDNVTEISTERRNGYSWYNSTPQQTVTRYAEWRTSHPDK